MNHTLRLLVLMTLSMTLAPGAFGASNEKKAKQFADRGHDKVIKGDFDGAIADYTRAIQLEPDCEACYANRGDAKREKKDFDGAIADCTEAIRRWAEASQGYSVDPSANQHALDRAAVYEVLAYANRGLAKEGKEDWDGAIADLTRVCELMPAALRFPENDQFGIASMTPGSTLASAYWKRGGAKLDKKDWDSAITDYTTAIQLKPGFAEAYSNRAFAKHKKGDEEGAKADLAKAIQLKPSLARQ